jgi:hypothetical protein
MEIKSLIQKPKKKISKGFIVSFIIIIIAVLGFAGLTKAGFLPNYFAIEFLCPNKNNFEQPFVQNNVQQPDIPSNVQQYYPQQGNGSIVPSLGIEYKPVIYLYPVQKQLVDVKINYQGNLIVSYPKYNEGWRVTAYPDGRLINQLDNQEYSYLFWEGIDPKANYDLSSGFMVKGADTAEFLQNKLAQLGLTPKEYNEFIVYWLPQMQNNKYNLIHFATKEEYNDRAKLEIKPQPDSLLRVFMVFKKSDEKAEVIPQEIKSFERIGFTVVEWGGTEVK